MKNLTKKSKLGDIISLDCGYGGPDYRDCKIINKPYDSNGLFGGTERNFPVEIVGTNERFTTSIKLI